MSKKGNCPYCGSSSCKLGMSDFIGKGKGKHEPPKQVDSLLSKFAESEEFKDHMKRIENDRKLGKSV